MYGVVALWWLLATLSAGLATEDLSFSVDTKRYSHVVSDKFLSITIDPTLLMDAEYSSGITKVMNLARGLAPAYVRLGSPASNRYQFKKAGTHRQHNASYAVTEAQWMILNDFAQKSGLEPIVCVNIMSRQGRTGTWDTRNLRDLIAYSDRRKYKLSWQMGYELQQHKNIISGTDLGNDVKTLRSILDSFPRYKQSKLVGPDIISTNEQSDLKFLREFLHSAGNALSAVTWHAFENTNMTQFDGETNTLAVGENTLADQLGNDFTSKPLWIAESYRDPRQPSQFEDGLSWAVKLGEAARIGVQMVMKRPQINNLQTPTPDYWVSFLHKTLVGDIILANDWVPPGDVHMFSHCANTRKPTSNVFVNDQLRYEEGSMTFFGVNWLPNQVNISLRLSSFTKRSRDVELHEYIITPDSSQASLGFKPSVPQVPKVLLNGRPLSLDFTGRLPILTPRVHHYTNRMALTLPGRSVGFWVVSGAKVRACVFKDGNYQDDRSWEEGVTRVKRSAETDPGGKDGDTVGDKIEHDTDAPSKIVQKKSIPNSQIVMEIGNWKEGMSKTKESEKIIDDKNKDTHNSKKDILDPRNVAEQSLDEMASEVQIITPETTSNQLGNHSDNNYTDFKTLNQEETENTDKPKYRISKVLVVFENELETQKNKSHDDDKKALLVDEETVISGDKEFSRVSRALEKDAFAVPNIPLSLLDMAALREPLISLKRLREKRWEQLQRKKLLAAQEYKKSLSLQASMLFPKKWISAVPKISLMQPKVMSTEEQENDYDYISEEEEPEVEYTTQHLTNEGQWNIQNKQKSDILNGALTKHGHIWDIERGLMDGPHLQEQQRHTRENAEEVHIGDEKEISKNESPEIMFVYGRRNVRGPELDSKNVRRAHFESKLEETPTFKYLEESDISNTGSAQEKRSYWTGHSHGCFDNPHQAINRRHPSDEGPYHSTRGKHVDLEQAEHKFLNKREEMVTTRHAQPRYRRENHRDRRHLMEANKRDESLESYLSDVLMVNDNEDKERDRKEVSPPLGWMEEHKGIDGAAQSAIPSKQLGENTKQDSSAEDEKENKGSLPTSTPIKLWSKKNRKRDGYEEQDAEKYSNGNILGSKEQNMDVRDANKNANQGYWDWADKIKVKPIPNKPIQLPKLKPLLNLIPLAKPLPGPKFIPNNKLFHKAKDVNNVPLPTPLVLSKLKPIPRVQPPNIPSLQGKFADLVSELKSKTHSILDGLEKKKPIPLPIARGRKIPASLSHLKEKFAAIKHNAASKIYAQPDKRDDEVSQVESDTMGHDLDASTPHKRDDDVASKVHSVSILDHDAHASFPDKRDHDAASKVDLDDTYQEVDTSTRQEHHSSVKRSHKKLKLANSILNQESFIVGRSAEFKSQHDSKNEVVGNPKDILDPTSNDKPAVSSDKGKEKDKENMEIVTDSVLELTAQLHHDQSSELQTERNPTDMDHDRMKRHAEEEDKASHNQNHKMVSTDKRSQHSKKRFLKIKHLYLMDSPKNEGDLNDPTKSIDYSHGRNVIHRHQDFAQSEAVVHCPTDSNIDEQFTPKHKSNANVNAQPTSKYVASKCIKQQDNSILKKHSQQLSTTSSNADKERTDSSKSDDSRSKSWKLRNNAFNSLRPMEPSNIKENVGIKSDNQPFIKPIKQNQYNVNNRLKRYIDMLGSELDSKEFLNKKLIMVDTNSNEDSSEDRLKKTLSPIEKIPHFINTKDKFKYNPKIGENGIGNFNGNKRDSNILDPAGKSSSNVDRMFKDWNLALGPHGLQIEAEQAKVARAFEGFGRTWRYEHTEGKNKATSNKPRTTYYGTKKTPPVVTNEEASQKLGFFGNILNKIYSLFNSVFSKPTN